MCSNHSPFLPLWRFTIMMPTRNALPELLLSKKGAMYLLKRNASAEALLRKQSFLIDKAKAKQEKFFDREREMFLQNQAKRRVQTTQLCRLATSPLTIIAGTEVEKKWEVDSDVMILYKNLRGNQGFSLNNKPSFASSKHFVSVSDNLSGNQHLSKILRPEPSNESGSMRRLKEFTCVLPPLQSGPHKFSRNWTDAVLNSVRMVRRNQSHKRD